MPNIPIHPAVVHFPIVLSMLLPLFAVGAIWAIRRGARSARAWSLTVLVATALIGSGYAAVRTGEREEERVERVVGETVLSRHEAAAQRFMALTAVVAVVAWAGLMPGVVGAAARWVATAASLVIVFAGFKVGQAGGDLVYRHNAASAYATSAASAGPIESMDHD